ncbi:MAG: hypothetical protein PVJ80_04485 [Gemmatimonadota bacterium]
MLDLATLAQLLGLWIAAGLTSWAWFVAVGLRFEVRGAKSVAGEGAAHAHVGAR